MELTTLEKIKKARINIQRKNSFFAYLSLYLKLEEDTSNILPNYAGMGVDATGTLLYKKEFVDKLSPSELVGVLVHEILHLALLHLLRLGHKHPIVWNLAADVCVNQLVKDNGFTLPDGCVVSDHTNTIDLFGIKIKDTNKKSAEQVYDELKPLLKDMKQLTIQIGKMQGSGKGMFDKHEYGKGGGKGDKDKKDGQGNALTEAELQQLEKEWKDKMEEAYVVSKMRGDVPSGIERMIGKLHEQRVSWRTVLLKYIQKTIPYDYTYNFPSKKSISSGVYMPSVVKEGIDVVVAIDTSGSIGQQELRDFISEIIGISKAFTGRVRMRLVTHDVKVYDDLVIQNGNIAKINEMKLHGGGGTSHKIVLEHVNKECRACKLMIAFTDGDSDLDNIDLSKYGFDKLFVISENGHDHQLKNKAVSIIKLKDYVTG